MKKTQLVWRLSKLPTVEDIDTLIDKKIITQEEAREILFSSQEERDAKSLEDEIKFLRELVDKLSQRSQIIETIKTIEIEKPTYPSNPWYKPYEVWCGNTTHVGGDGNYPLSTGTNCDFNSIKTF